MVRCLLWLYHAWAKHVQICGIWLCTQIFHSFPLMAFSGFCNQEAIKLVKLTDMEPSSLNWTPISGCLDYLAYLMPMVGMKQTFKGTFINIPTNAFYPINLGTIGYLHVSISPMPSLRSPLSEKWSSQQSWISWTYTKQLVIKEQWDSEIGIVCCIEFYGSACLPFLSSDLMDSFKHS